MIEIRQLLSFCVASLLITGCATIFGSGPQAINMKSEPQGAAYQYGPYSGKTPDTVQASRAELAHTATFALAGYESKTVPVETGIQGVTWVDVLFWPGFIVDFVTGNAYKVNTPDVTASLTPVAGAVPVAQPAPAQLAPAQLAPAQLAPAMALPATKPL